MSPKSGEEVLLSEIETEILSIFVRRKILDDREISDVLRTLVLKLNGGNNV